jgi:hypothetical protein
MSTTLNLNSFVNFLRCFLIIDEKETGWIHWSCQIRIQCQSVDWIKLSKQNLENRLFITRGNKNQPAV